jgi:O-antigen/teichoic acid export membrane protein
MLEKSVKSQVILALKWTAAARFTGQMITWAITIVVIRLLSPGDYGLVATAGILIGFAGLVQELGLIPALVQAKDVDETRIRQVFGFILISNIVIFGILFLISPYFALFFGQPELENIIRVLGITFLISALSSVPVAMLRRELKLKVISLVELCATVLGSLATLGLAYSGYGVWALVLGNVLTAAASTIIFLAVTRFHAMPIFSLSGMREMAIFGANVTLSRTIWYFGGQADVMLIGKFLGNEMLGIYSVVNHLASMPLSKLMGIVNQIAFPAFCKIQEDKDQCREYFLLSAQLISLVTFPLLWGLSSVSPEFIHVFLGSNWAEASIVLMLIPLIVPLKSLDMILSPMLEGIGHPEITLRNVITRSVVLPILILAGINLGIVGVSALYAAGYLPVLYLNCRRSLKQLDTNCWELFLRLRTIILCSGMMYLAVYVSKVTFLADLGVAWRLSGSIIVGALVFGGLSWLFNRRVLMDVVSLVRNR